MKFCSHSKLRLWRTGMLLLTKSKGLRSNSCSCNLIPSIFYKLNGVTMYHEIRVLKVHLSVKMIETNPHFTFRLVWTESIIKECRIVYKEQVQGENNYLISMNSFRGNYSFLNMEIAENSNSCHKFPFFT